MSEPRPDVDSPWKDALERFFPACMALYFAEAYARIDWARGVEFLDKELQRIAPRGALGRRVVDKLAKVYLLDGGEIWVLVYLEVQGQPDAGFPERMFVYSYRLFDRYHRPVASFGILTDADPRWRPECYQQEVLGCRITMQFPIVKLQDFRCRWEELAASDNPFAALTMAHLLTQETARQPEQRLAAKLDAVRRLRRMGLSREDREELFRLVDWIMVLPEALQIEFDDTLMQEDETVPFVTSIERRATERGRQEGQALMLIRLLEQKFGPLEEALRSRVFASDEETLVRWLGQALKADRLEDVFA